MEEKLYNLWYKNLENNEVLLKELNEIKDNNEEIKDRFYQSLKFGTAGLRGVMALGTNRMNTYTVGAATQGFANYINKQTINPVVSIGYDSRNNSLEFAKHTASVLSANNIKVNIYKDLAPTPLVAYATINTNSDFGVMITASHNPKEYNGYKVFNSLGCQIDNIVATAIESEIKKIDIFKDIKINDFNEQLNKTITYLDQSIINDYHESIMKLSINNNIKKSDLNLVYTPLNGTGNKYVRKVLKDLGVEKVNIVKEQELPDGNFPTCPYPNPEFKEALELGLKLSNKLNADALLATDPDADRFALAVRHNNDYQIINGNELGVLLLDYIASNRIKKYTLPKNPIAIRSIVSTKLFDKVAKEYGVKVIDVLTGFKYIGEVIEELDKENIKDSFIFGYEEACGYLIGTHVRDKDAVVTSALVTEMLAEYKLINKTLVDRLEEIQEKYGFYNNYTDNIAFTGQEGMEKMENIMSNLRKKPLKEIAGLKIIEYLDYFTRKKITNNEETQINKEASNVIEYRFENNNSIMIRPSGTEPKLKIYYNFSRKTKEELNNLPDLYNKIKEELI